MNKYAAAPAYNRKAGRQLIAPYGARSYRYWRNLIQKHEEDSEPCWRLTDVGVCLQQTTNQTGLCNQHLDELRNW